MENQDILRNAAGENWDFGDLRLMSGQPMNLSNAQSMKKGDATLFPSWKKGSVPFFPR
jgi:hypothetical protein